MANNNNNNPVPEKQWNVSAPKINLLTKLETTFILHPDNRIFRQGC